MSTLNIQLLCRRSIDFPELAIFASRPGAMINLHWLELPMAQTLFHGPKGVRAIKFDCIHCCTNIDTLISRTFLGTLPNCLKETY